MDNNETAKLLERIATALERIADSLGEKTINIVPKQRNDADTNVVETREDNDIPKKYTRGR